MIYGPQCHKRAQAQKKTATTEHSDFDSPASRTSCLWPVAPVVHETKDRTRHQLHSLLYMGWRRIYFFDEIYGWRCVRIYLFYVLMMVDDLIWFDLRLTWLLHWWTRVQSPLSLTIFPFHYISFETFLPSSCCKQKGGEWESTSTCYVRVDVFIIGPGVIWFWNLSYLLFLFCLTA